MQRNAQGLVRLCRCAKLARTLRDNVLLIQVGIVINICQCEILLRRLAVLFLLSVSWSCKQVAVKPAAYGGDARIVFQNSFETEKDSALWLWSGEKHWSKDVPPGGGQRSLYIKGGRISPTASMVTRPLTNGASYGLECWGKAVNVGGFVELAIVDKHEIIEKITIPVIKSEWQKLSPESALYCPAGHSLMLTLHAAATPDAAVMVDLVRILKAPSVKR